VLAGLILAGGEGVRFGGPKAWARLPDGRTFLAACAEALISGVAVPVVATLPPGTEDPRIEGLGVLVLPEAGMDMFGSLIAGLTRLLEAPDWRLVAVLPVDHPLVRPATVRALAGLRGVAAVPAFSGKHGHPVCLDREIVVDIAHGQLPGPTLRDVLRAVGTVDLAIDDSGVVANCNTPEALAEALKTNSEF
jgi:CTP:molybdopterin cytidylyltransferase MocA